MPKGTNGMKYAYRALCYEIDLQVIICKGLGIYNVLGGGSALTIGEGHKMSAFNF